MTANFFVRNMERLAPLYGAEIPTLHHVRIRSIELNWGGPTIHLRMDLPDPPLPFPPEWADAGMDTLQCHFDFTAVDDLVLENWNPPVLAQISVSPTTADTRVRVTVSQEEITFLEFTCNVSVLVGHLSAFRLASDGTDQGPHLFKSKVDQLLHHTSIPQPYEATFYERI